MSLTQPIEDDELADLIERVREARLSIAIKRFAQTRIRYPEIAHTDVEPLSDEEVIKVALKRELHHVETTVKNMEKDD